MFCCNASRPRASSLQIAEIHTLTVLHSMGFPVPRLEGKRDPTRNSRVQRRPHTPTSQAWHVAFRRCDTPATSPRGISSLGTLGRGEQADLQANPSRALTPNPHQKGEMPQVRPIMSKSSNCVTSQIITSRRSVTLLLAVNISAFGLLVAGCGLYPVWPMSRPPTTCAPGGGWLPFCRAARAAPAPSRQAPLPACNGPVDGRMAAALTRAVYAAVQAMQVMDEEDFQRETFKLREREYRYYAAANAYQLPSIPDLSDNTGGLSNPSYLNFICYCLWKVVYRHMTDPASRQAFARQVAANLLARLETEDGGGVSGLSSPLAMPVPLTAVSGLAPDAAVRTAVLPLLELLRARGYLCTYQLVLGAHPGTWPQDWMNGQPQVLDVTHQGADAGDMGLLEAEEAASTGPDVEVAVTDAGTDSGVPEAGRDGFEGSPASSTEFLFQVKLHRPADLLASVALRSEEDGAWPRTVSNCLVQVLARQGYGTHTGMSYGLQGEVQSDAPGGTSAWCVEVDEFFYQDAWQGPSGWAERLLLLLGDPLEQVGVDFVPTTLVQNWRLRLGGRAPRASGGGNG